VQSKADRNLFVDSKRYNIFVKKLLVWPMWDTGANWEFEV